MSSISHLKGMKFRTKASFTQKFNTEVYCWQEGSEQSLNKIERIPSIYLVLNPAMLCLVHFSVLNLVYIQVFYKELPKAKTV